MSQNFLVSLCAVTTLGLAACGGGSGDDGAGTPDANNAQFDASVSVEADAAVPPDAGDACDLCVAEATCEVDVCSCPQGFEGDGTTAGTGCTAEVGNECADGTHDCTLSCVDTDEGFTCNDRILLTYRELASFDIVALTYDPDPLIDDSMVIESTVEITGSLGEVFSGTTGLATDPTTGTTYVVVKEGVKKGVRRHLAQLDTVTGVATVIGTFTQPVSTIAFDDAGVLFGITGRAATPTTEYSTISLADATLTPILELGEGKNADGETLASRAGDPLMYRWSGNGPFDFKSVDSLGVEVDLLQPTFGEKIESEKTAAVHSNVLDAFVVVDISSNMYIYGLDETGDLIAGPAEATPKGITFVPAPAITP
tara:strand:+ start:6167 stop:7270 length:1104 start_codon:yes stop_codon:yes gene_type:complete